jgi:hypothetical protein
MFSMNRRLFPVLLSLIICGSSYADINSVRPRQNKEYYLVNSIDNGGINWRSYPPPANTPQDWKLINNEYYITDGREMRTNVFSTDFKYIRSYHADPPYYWGDLDFVKLKYLDILISQAGKIKRVDLQNKILCEYDLSKEWMDRLGLIMKEDLNDSENSIIVYPNWSDGVIFNNMQLAFVLLPSSRILKEESELKDYIEKSLFSHTWTGKNSKFAISVLKDILVDKDIIGEKEISSGIQQSLMEKLVKYFSDKGINVPLNDIDGQLKATDRGFFSRAKWNKSEYREYYFDLISDKVFLISGVTHENCVFWSDLEKKALRVRSDENQDKISIIEYSLSFLDPEIQSASVKEIISTSMLIEPNDKNAYHPIKILDNDPKTMWIENKKEAGLGESIRIVLNRLIKIDEIRIMPGCFYKEFWKQNYRVKQLEVMLDTKKQQIYFKDEMLPQSIKFESPIEFIEANLKIKDTYPTMKWEDTAISEISFYYEGFKINIDYPDFYKYLFGKK